MESTFEYVDYIGGIIKQLKKREKATCPKCGKDAVVGIKGIDPSKCHYFSCGKCGAHFHWDPLVIVE